MKTESTRYKGLTKRYYKHQFGSSTPGKEKAANCHATQLDKALAKYPRAIKTMPDEYIAFNLKKDHLPGHLSSFFTQNFD